MQDFSDAFGEAFRLIVEFDPALAEIIVLSLEVSLTAVMIAALIGLPVGAALAVLRFPGRQFLITLINALMGLPPVVVGLVVYLLLSRAGPLGPLGLLGARGLGRLAVRQQGGLGTGRPIGLRATRSLGLGANRRLGLRAGVWSTGHVTLIRLAAGPRGRASRSAGGTR